MRLLLTLLRRAPKMVVWAAIAGGVSGAASTGLLALLNSTLWQESSIGERFVLSFLGLCLLIPVTQLVSYYLIQRLGQGEIMRLRLELSREILRTSLRRLEALGAPRLLSVLTDDIRAISDSIGLLPVVVINASIVVGCMSYLAWLSPKLFGVLIGLFVFGSVTYQLPVASGMKRLMKARDAEDTLFEHFRGLTEGTKELLINRQRRQAFFKSLTGVADEQRDLRLTANMIFGASNAWGQLLIFVVVAGLLLLAESYLGGVTREQLGSYVLVLIYMMTPLQVCLSSLPHLGRANVAIGRIDELGFTLRAGREDGPIELETTLPAARSWRELRLDDVTYTYDEPDGQEDRYTFHVGPIDLTFRPGELVFLVGGNGSGKTSLAKILLGLYAPDGGRVVLDGEAITDQNREAYRGLFSAVFSDFFLFEELLGLDDARLEERAGAHLSRLQLQEKVRVEDGAFSTTSLSQGQRKRLALLVAYLEDRQVYLFDEWAADQDPGFKKFFYEILLGELKARGKTVFAISHDDHYYHVADRIIKMHDGRVEFDGVAADFPRQLEVGTAEVPSH